MRSVAASRQSRFFERVFHVAATMRWVHRTARRT